MTYRGKTGGRKYGTRSQQTFHRRLPMEDVTGMNALQRLRYASDFCFALADRELAKGDRADITFVVDMMQRAALLTAKGASYAHPKFAAMPFDSNPPRYSMDLTKLSDDELMALERIYSKAQVQVEAEESPRSPDEYLASTKSIAEGETKGDAQVGRRVSRQTTSDQPASGK